MRCLRQVFGGLGTESSPALTVDEKLMQRESGRVRHIHDNGPFRTEQGSLFDGL